MAPCFTRVANFRLIVYLDIHKHYLTVTFLYNVDMRQDGFIAIQTRYNVITTVRRIRISELLPW